MICNVIMSVDSICRIPLAKKNRVILDLIVMNNNNPNCFVEVVVENEENWHYSC